MMRPKAVHCSAALIGPELEMAREVTIEIENGSIAGVETGADPPTDALRLEGLTVLPGFIDSHVHIGFYEPIDVLSGGVTTVRDLAWPPERIYPLVARSKSAEFPGPEILAAGPMLTCPGGYPTRAGWAPEGTGRVVTDEDDARRAVDERVSEGAVIVKIALNPPVGPTLSARVLQVICDRARETGLEVTGHIFGLAELDKALGCGVNELAHMLMSRELIPDETIERMVAAGMRIVPTLSVHHWPTKRMTIRNLAAFVHRGGEVIYGTDLGNSGPRPGIDATEINRMERSRMTPHQIVASATVRAAAALRLDDRGSIEPGKRADLIAVRGDPLDAPVALRYLAFVMRGGLVHRLET